MLDQLSRMTAEWVGAALGVAGARANVAADLAELHARLLEIESLAVRLAHTLPRDTSRAA